MTRQIEPGTYVVSRDYPGSAFVYAGENGKPWPSVKFHMGGGEASIEAAPETVAPADQVDVDSYLKDPRNEVVKVGRAWCLPMGSREYKTKREATLRGATILAIRDWHDGKEA